MNHIEACGECPKETWYGTCPLYFDRSFLSRLGGCGHFPYRELPAQSGLSYLDGKILGRGRIGQQKQKHNDKSYHSKNDRRGKFRGVTE
jgi:hypothetical protein